MTRCVQERALDRGARIVARSRVQFFFLVAMALVPAAAAAQESPPGGAVVAADTSRTYTLTECARQAIQNNRELRHARLGLQVANRQVREAWGEVFPSIDADVTYTRNLTSQTGFFPAIFFDPDAQPGELVEVQFSGDNLWNTSVFFEQPIIQAEAFIGLGAAGRFRSLQTERLRGVAQQSVTDVRTHYYRMVIAQELLRVLRSSIDRVQETLAGAQGLEHAGLGSAYDVLRLEVELATLEPNLQRAQNQLDDAARDLKLAMGIPIHTPLRVVGELYTLDVAEPQNNSPENRQILEVVGVPVHTPADVDSILQLARRNRSELLQAQHETALAQSQLAAERATAYPKLSAFANYRLDAQENGSPDFFGESELQRASNWQAGLRLEVPILEGGQRFQRVGQRKLQLQQSRTRQELAGEAMENAVRSLVAGVLEARERAAAQKRAVAQAQRGYEIATAEYRNGLGTQLAANDAEETLRQAEFSYAEAVFDMLQSQADLDVAVGVVPLVDGMEERP